ncbi:MAG: type II toxin-antitoxin system RelE/ParE family toxin [Verrucomicrobiae bacterium]|nr:type II toxin-antitoxin system RelE/ParE family toxin [Verrucomicrobiae bacterium]
MTFGFYPAAEQEYLESARYYDEQGEDLDDYFVRDIEATIAKILQNPFTWRKISRHAHRCLASNFPYGVIYAVEDEHITILAVAHFRRKPGYWQGRVRRWKAGM